MKLKTSHRGAVTVIELDGNLLGGPDAAVLKNKLHELIEAGKNRVVVDLKGIEFMNSSGLAMLISGLTTIRDSGGDLKIANASEKIVTVIKVTKLGAMFQNHPTVEAAVDALRS